MNSGVTLSNGTLDISGNFTNQSDSDFRMSSESDTLKVAGDFIFNGEKYASAWSKGSIYIGGNAFFCENSNIDSSGTHKIVFNGKDKQTVTFENEVSKKLNTIQIENKSLKGVTISGDYYFKTGTIDLKGKTLTIDGNLIQSAGTLNANGGTLNVTGDYRIQEELIDAKGTKEYRNSSAYLVMTDTGAKVNVGGDFITRSTYTHEGKLTAGTLSIGGNFTQAYGDMYNFYTSGTHMTKFIGEREHVVSFYSSSRTKSHFTNLDISGQKINMIQHVLVCGTMNTTNADVNGYIDITKGTRSIGTLNANIRVYSETIDLYSEYELSGDMIINGDLHIEIGTMNLKGKNLKVLGDVTLTGKLQLSEGMLEVAGDFTNPSSGYIYMEYPTDTINIAGDFILNSKGYSSTFRHGKIYIGGNAKFSSYDNIYLGKESTHEVIFNGTDKQTITFDSPTTNKLNVIRFENTSPLGVEITETLNYVTVINERGGNVRFSNGGYVGGKLIESKTIDGDYNLITGELDLNGHTLTVEKDLIQSGGTINANRGVLNVQGNLVRNTGGFDANNGTINIEKDLRQVEGTFDVNNATLEIKGDLNQSGGTFDVNNGTLEIKGDLSQSGGTFNANNGTLNTERDLSQLGGTLDANNAAINIKSNLIQSKGTLNVNNGILNITGDYRLQAESTAANGTKEYRNSTGYLQMTKSGDKVNVAGDFVTQSSNTHDGKLTDGTLTIGGDFIQAGGNASNFKTSVNHTVNFIGDKVHTVNFSDSNSSRFTNFDISSQKINLTSRAAVAGILTTENAEVDGYIDIINDTKFIGVISADIRIGGGYTLSEDLHIKGNVNIESQLNLNGKTLTIEGDLVQGNGIVNINGGTLNVNGDYRLQTENISADKTKTYTTGTGYLRMTNSNDKVNIGGNLYLESSKNTAGYLTDGVLEINGHILNGATLSPTFIASSNHMTILNGGSVTDPQTVKRPNANVKFNTLKLVKTLPNYAFTDAYNNKEINPTSICNKLIIIDKPKTVENLKAERTGLTEIKLTWNNSTSVVGIAGYDIYRDEEKITTVTSLSFIDTTVNLENTYTYQIYAFDKCGNYSDASDKASASLIDDDMPPTTPKNLVAYSRTGSSITLRWDISTDNIRVHGYKIYENGEEVGEATGALYKCPNLEKSKEYRFTVKAFDEAGNYSDISNEITAITVMPKIENITPKDYSEIGGANQNITVSFANSGNSTGNKVKLEYSTKTGIYTPISENLINQTSYWNTLSASYNWNLTNQPSGEIDVKITLFDADNNTDIKYVTYTIDNTRPLPPSEVNADSLNGQALITWFPSASANCTSYKIYRAEIPEAIEGNGEIKDSANDIKYTLLTTVNERQTIRYVDRNVTIGKAYSYKITAVSKFALEGDYSEPTTLLVGTDEQPPEIISITPDTARINKIKDITVKAQDNIEVTKITLEYKEKDASDWVLIGEKNPTQVTNTQTTNIQTSNAVFEFDTAALSDGAYILRAISYDAAGNVSDEFAKAYEIDNTGITKIIIKDDDCTASSSFVSLRWEDVSESDFSYFIVEMKKDDGGFNEAARTSTTTGAHIQNLQPNETYTFRVVGYDNLGNRGEPSDEIQLSTVLDIITPVIKSFYPAPSSFNTKIDMTITGEDNVGIKSLKLSYSYDDGDEKTWTDLTTLETTTKQFKYTLDVSTMPEGKNLHSGADI